MPSAAMAALRRPLALSFSGCGWLMSYHLGVSDLLLRAGCITPRSRFAGASGGALVAAALGCGLSPRDLQRQLGDMARKFRGEGPLSVWGNIEPSLRATLDDILPAHANDLCNGRVSIALTRARWKPDAWLVDRFHSRDELIDALVASSFVPSYLAPGFTRHFRGEPVIDGGFTELFPRIPGGRSACPYPHADKVFGTRVDIGPVGEVSLPQLMQESFFPANKGQVERQFEWGQQQAEAWLAQTYPRLPISAGLEG